MPTTRGRRRHARPRRSLDYFEQDVDRRRRRGARPSPRSSCRRRAAAMVASPTPSPLRDVRPAVRADVERDRELGHRRRAQSLELPGDRRSATTTFVIDDLAALDGRRPGRSAPSSPPPAPGCGSTVDQLAERTRIRPHVIESIEVDDFAPCGGDFYARGHLRTLARVLGVDAAPLLAIVRRALRRRADRPAPGLRGRARHRPDGPIRGIRGGPNWSVLVAAVMAVVLAWSIARLVMDSPVTLAARRSSTARRARPARPGRGAGPGACSTAAGGGAHVVVRDGTGQGRLQRRPRLRRRPARSRSRRRCGCSPPTARSR